MAENMQKVADIQRGFGHDAPVLVTPSRRFVHEASSTVFPTLVLSEDFYFPYSQISQKESN